MLCQLASAAVAASSCEAEQVRHVGAVDPMCLIMMSLTIFDMPACPSCTLAASSGGADGPAERQSPVETRAEGLEVVPFQTLSGSLAIRAGWPMRMSFESVECHP